MGASFHSATPLFANSLQMIKGAPTVHPGGKQNLSYRTGVSQLKGDSQWRIMRGTLLQLRHIRTRLMNIGLPISRKRGAGMKLLRSLPEGRTSIPRKTPDFPKKPFRKQPETASSIF
jgi:hypothetical protein